VTGRGNQPVVHVSWTDAVVYARWAGKRLPSAIEWEYASAGQAVMQGANSSGEERRWLANVWQGRYPEENSGEDGFVWLEPVGQFPTNEFGLCDMLGNVGEWCGDRAPGEAVRELPHQDESLESAVLGASYLSVVTASHGTVSMRMSALPGLTRADIGFRCAKDP
jgi:formylglycine-generating enzyme required for sulfatase activity